MTLVVAMLASPAATSISALRLFTASGFIDVLLKRIPFPIRAIQVDGDSEFQDASGRKYQKRGIKLFTLPPRSPKLNGHIERIQRSHTEELYEVTEAGFEIGELNRTLPEWGKRKVMCH